MDNKYTIASQVSTGDLHLAQIDNFVSTSKDAGTHTDSEIHEFLVYKAYEEFSEAAKLITEAFCKVDYCTRRNAKDILATDEMRLFLTHVTEVITKTAETIAVYEGSEEEISDEDIEAMVNSDCDDSCESCDCKSGN